jgi:hypothetical protein
MPRFRDLSAMSFPSCLAEPDPWANSGFSVFFSDHWNWVKSFGDQKKDTRFQLAFLPPDINLENWSRRWRTWTNRTRYQPAASFQAAFTYEFLSFLHLAFFQFPDATFQQFLRFTLPGLFSINWYLVLKPSFYDKKILDLWWFQLKVLYTFRFQLNQRFFYKIILNLGL